MKNTDENEKYNYYSLNQVKNSKCNFYIDQIIVKFKYFYEYVLFKKYGERNYSFYQFFIDRVKCSEFIQEKKVFNEFDYKFDYKFDKIEIIGFIVTKKINSVIVEIVLKTEQFDLVRAILQNCYDVKLLSRNFSDNIDERTIKVLKFTSDKNNSEDILLILIPLILLVGLIVLICNLVNGNEVYGLLIIYIALISVIIYGFVKYKISNHSKSHK